MTKSFYLNHSSLHKLSKFTTKAASIQVGNGQRCTMLFVIVVSIILHELHFEIFTLVSEMYGHANLVFGIKNSLEIEADVNNSKSDVIFSLGLFKCFLLKDTN